MLLRFGGVNLCSLWSVRGDVSLAIAFACILLQADNPPDLIRQLDHDDPAVRNAATEALHRLGSSLIPELEQARSHPSIEVRGRVAGLLDRIPDYALRPFLKHPRFPAFQRRWNAVIDAVIWKRAIPKEVWLEIDRAQREAHLQRDPPPHTADEILAELEWSTVPALRRLAWQVGIDGLDTEMNGGGMEPLIVAHDFLPLLLRAEADEVSFEEVYGTLLSLEFHVSLPDWERWASDELQTAVRLLVQIRRRATPPPFEPPKTCSQALKLACQGPIARGIADALGRAFANRGRFKEHLQDPAWRLPFRKGNAVTVRDIYEYLILLDRSIGPANYGPELLLPAGPTTPRGLAAVPDRHRGLYHRAISEPANDKTQRVVRDILERLGEAGDDLNTIAILLRSIADRVVETER
jgi:hypothetical protein